MEIWFRIGRGAGIGGTQGEVYRVAAQNNGVFNGGQVVGFIGAAFFAKDLHGDDLRVWRHTLDAHGAQRLGVCAIAVGDVSVCGGNALYMGAVLSLLVIVMGDIGILVHIVIAKGDFGVDIKLFSRDFAGDVQLTQYLRNLVCIQQVVIRYSFVGFGRLLCQGIVKGACVEGLMVGVNASVNHGNSGACTGVASCIGGAGADHGRGSGGVGVRFLCHSGGRIIAGFQIHVLNAGNILNGGNLAIGDVGRNDIGCQSQVPDNVQLATRSLLNLGLDAMLLLL